MINGEIKQLVDLERGLVSRRIFVEEDIYRLELERIFARAWMYLAHESQVPNRGDFVAAYVGEDPILVCRDSEGGIAAFINSCRHRGNRVCRADVGHTTSFLCPYHGWTYNTDGELIGVPGYKELYHGELDRSEWGLRRVTQVATYKGLIFGTFDPEAPGLDEFLGDMRWGLDLLLDQGDMVAVPGIVRWRMDCNWKIASDNAIGDMYHANVAHRSAILAGHSSGTGTARRTGNLAPGRQGAGFSLITEYGHGLNASYIDEGAFNWESPAAEWRKRADVKERLGELRSKVNRANMNVFPNLFVNSGSRELMVRNPLGPTRIEVWKTTLVDRSASPEQQRAHIRASNRHFGPAGMFEQEDGENWDQSTLGAKGVVARRDPLNYAMALGHAEFLPRNGHPPMLNTLTNEHNQLWMYRCWAEFIAAESWQELRARHSSPEEIR